MLTLAELDDLRDRRDRLKTLAAVCALAVALSCLATSDLSDTDIAGASGEQSFEEWYADDANAFWYWYTSDERNASFFHLRQHFGNGYLGDQSIRVGQCESELRPRAKSRTNDHGVMQINAVHRSQFERVTGVTWSPNVYHAEANARYARWLYDQQGWGPWTCKP